MTKDIHISSDVKGKRWVSKKKDIKPRFTLTDKAAIRDALVGYEEIKTVKDCNILLPNRTMVRYMNKEDKMLRRGVIFVNVINNCIGVRSGAKYWRVSLDKHKIFARSRDQEDFEKILFVDYLEDSVNNTDISIIKNGKQLSWDELLAIYMNDTL